MTADQALDSPTTAEDSPPSPLSSDPAGGGSTVSPRWRKRRYRSRDLTPRRYLLIPALMLLAAALSQRPGKIAPDTKVALVLNPGQFLSAALHLWDPTTDSGSIGNQSTGYLMPMGPFFLLTHAVGINPALAQRLWLGLLLIVSFWGLVRLADALGMGNRTGRILGGMAYALSPFVLSRIGDNSALLLGDVMLPWVLLPLVRVTYPREREDEPDPVGDEAGGRLPLRPLSARRAAALSGFAVLLTGGINATVTFDMLLVPALWLAIMCRGRGAWILRGWWVAAVICATSWWVVSLQLLGTYGVNFVKYTESATTTTSVTSLTETLRGTADWLGYLRFGDAELPSAWTYINAPAAIAASFLLLTAGFVGLSRMRVPARRFLVVCLALGVVAVGAAYAGSPHGVLSAQWLRALAGPLDAFRNINKFQPLIRLPIALGLANCLPVLGAWFARHRRSRHTFTALAAGLLSAIIVLGAAPLGLSRIYQPGTFSAVPSYWKQATAYLNKTSNGTRTLLVPGSGFGTYTWGDPNDEPMLWLSKQPWAVRDIIPLGGVNSTRWLDGIELQLEQRATPALAQTLARAGFGYVLVRNDLPKISADQPPSTDEVDTALAHSGLKRVASFGPMVTGRPTGIDAYLKVKAAPGRYPSLEIYALPTPSNRVDAYPVSSLAVLSGGPEALPVLSSTGLLGDRPTVLAADVAAGSAGNAQLPAADKPSTWIDTDTLTRRDEQFGSIHSGDSYVLQANQKVAGEKAQPQTRLDVNPDGHQTVAVYSGISSVTASNYGFVLGAVPAAGPPAAVDGDPTTAWSVSGFPKKGVGQWLQLTFPKPIKASYLYVSLLAESKKRVRIASLKVTTTAGSLIAPVGNTELPQRIKVPAGATSTIRLTIASVANLHGNAALYGPGIREIAVPGVKIVHSVELPNDAAKYFPPGGPTTQSFLFSRDRSDPHQFLDLDVERQISRTFTVLKSSTFVASGTAVDRDSTLPASIKGSTVSLACGTGPDVQIDKTRYKTYLHGSRSQLAAGQPIPLGLCTLTPIRLAAGTHTIQTLNSTSPDYQVSIGIATLTLTNQTAKPAPERKVTVTRWGDEDREVLVAPGARAILTVHENFNNSWKATADGKHLTAIRVDGWQQGFIVPAGGAISVHLANAPAHTYRRDLLISAFLVLLLLIAAFWPSRRNAIVSGPRRWSLLVTRAAVLVLACLTTLLVAGPLVTAAVPVLALVIWSVRRLTAVLAVAGVAVAAGVGLAHQKAYPSSHLGVFSSTAQIASALALAVVLLAAGLRVEPAENPQVPQTPEDFEPAEAPEPTDALV